MASTDESSDEDEMSEDGLDNKQLKKSTTNAPIPFREYKKKHSRSRTDPLKLSREVRSKSPRYHSDPQGNDSTTTSSCESSYYYSPTIRFFVILKLILPNFFFCSALICTPE